jgi:hypothetical protein
MPERKYDPVAYSNAMTVFKENLHQSSPEAFDMLFDDCVGFSYTPEAFVWTFLTFNSEDKYECLSAGPLFEYAFRFLFFSLRLFLS